MTYRKRTGSLYTTEEFIELCMGGYLIDYDGFEEYADVEGVVVESGTVLPSDIKDGKLKTKHTHVLWYNR